MDAVDVARIDARLDHQNVVDRNDLHQGLARRDDAAGRKDLQVDDCSGYGRADDGAGHDVYRRAVPLPEIGDVRLDFAQLLVDLAVHVRRQVDDAQFGFADALLRPGDERAVSGTTAFDIGGLALQLQQARSPLEPPVDQILDIPDLVGDQPKLLGLGPDLGVQAGDLLAILGDALFEDGGLAVDRVLAALVDALLRSHDLGRFGAGLAFGDQPVGEHDGLLLVAFGDEPCLARR